MCGILGIIGRPQPHATMHAVQRALDLVRHRGPDDEGFLLFDSETRHATAAAGPDTNRALERLPRLTDVEGAFDVIFGHRRLSIQDVSVAGHQPMPSADERFWIVFNGEIYNFVELREELTRSGRAFRTGTDTEVLLAAYETWGAGMLSRLTGMFTLAILDVAERTVFLARDPFGIKPLYWTRIGEATAFASEIAPLLALRSARPTGDVDSLYRYLRFGVTDGAGSTMFAGIHQLPAAHYVIFDATGKERQPARPFWTPGAVPRRDISLEEASRELRALLAESIRLHLRSDVPLGTCLSGGLDSTAIAAFMRLQLGVNAPIHSFSFVSDDPQTGEGPYVDIATRALGLCGHNTSPSADDMVSDLDSLIRLQEQPFGSTSIYAQYCVFRLAQQTGVTVMLDGQGSDELFGGYQTAISAQLSSAILRGRLLAARSLAGSSHVGVVPDHRRVILSAAGRMLPAALAAPFMAIVGEPLYPRWLNRKWFTTRGHRAESRPQGRGRDSLREELLHFVNTLSLPALLRYEDRNSMAFSIESRVPFCTTQIADFAFSLTSSHLVGWDGETKAVLRRALAGIVPREIIQRPKIGFATPERAWLRSLQPWVRDVVGSDAFRSLPFIEHDVVDEVILAQIDSDTPMHGMAWRLLNIAMWANAFGVGFDAM